MRLAALLPSMRIVFSDPLIVAYLDPVRNAVVTPPLERGLEAFLASPRTRYASCLPTKDRARVQSEIASRIVVFPIPFIPVMMLTRSAGCISV